MSLTRKANRGTAATSVQTQTPANAGDYAQGPGGEAKVQKGLAARREHPVEVSLFPHTHWDREWWTTKEDYRARMVEMIDALLEQLDADPDFKNFSLDGQSIMLTDYLEIRPENREKVSRYLKEGRLLTGPWHVQADQTIPSGESHLRNLWLAERVAHELGDIPLQKLGYIPDSFGHISQMPQLLRGWGIDKAAIWRGAGGPRQKTEFWWEAPDKSRVLTHWFPDGYYQTDFLHFDKQDAGYEKTFGRLRGSIERNLEHAPTDAVLIPVGGDHLPSDPWLPRHLREASKDLKGQAHLVWSTPARYLDEVAAKHPKLGVHKGELRGMGPGYPSLLPNVISTRLPLKQKNARVQSWLESYAEPLSALAWQEGGKYDAGLLWRAWQYLLENQPHDSMSGTGTDDVHREMVTRYEQAEQLGRILSAKSVDHLNQQIDTRSLRDGEQALVVHNTLPQARSGLVTVSLPGTQGLDPHTHVLTDGHGHEVPFQVHHVNEQRPMTDQSHWTEVEFVAPRVPGLGHATYRLAKREKPLDRRMLLATATVPVSNNKGVAAPTDLRVGTNLLENRFLQVRIDERTGTFAVTDKTTGERYDGLNAFEDAGDGGDEYNHSALLHDQVLQSAEHAKVQVSLVEAGYAKTTYRVDLDWELPKEISENRLSRSTQSVTTRLSSFITLTADGKAVDVKTEWDNQSRDHRLRALFPLGADVESSQAESAFDIVERPTRGPKVGRDWTEVPDGTQPEQGFVSVHQGKRGLTIANKGLPEYEVKRDGQGTVALTLLRSVGWLSREDFLSRRQHAGPPIPTPEAQGLGKQSVEYEIIPHAGSVVDARAYLTAQQFRTPLYGSVTDRHGGKAPKSAGALELTGEHTLMMSALKKAERSDAQVLRFWNTARQKTEAGLRFGAPPKSVRLVNLKEERIPGGELHQRPDGTYALPAGPAQIVTVAVEY